MKLSARIQKITASQTIAAAARAAQMKADGIDVVSFGAGEPDFDTPAFIKDAAKAALDAGDTKYMPRSAKALVAAIVEKLARENAVEVKPEQVVVAFGGKNALYLACQCLVDTGDRVLVPAPYWNSYVDIVKLCDGEPVVLPTTRESGFKVTPDQILVAAKGAKILMLNYPSNPTGVMYTPAELKAIAEAVLKTDLIVFSDEIYEKLVFGGRQFVSFAALDKRLPERTITLNALSKTFSMTGWRLGWAAGPKDAIGAMRNLISQATTNPVSFAQAGALEAYRSPKSAEAVEKMRQAFEQRGAHMSRRLNAMAGVQCVAPDGAFYCFPDVSAHYGRKLNGVDVTDSTSFAKAALETMHVALVAGEAFGEDKCVRLSFATSLEQIDKGLDRIEKMLK